MEYYQSVVFAYINRAEIQKSPKSSTLSMILKNHTTIPDLELNSQYRVKIYLYSIIFYYRSSFPQY